MKYKTDEQLTAHILNLYTQRKSLDEIAELVGYKRSVITRLLREAGALIRRRGKAQKHFIVNGEKHCSGPCEKDRPITDFGLHSGTYDGLQSWCRECRTKHSRGQRLKAKFGITELEYNTMLEAQNGVCAICGQSETRIKFGRPTMLAVDHNHKTGKVRQLICSKCNMAIGLIDESPTRCDRIRDYLIQHNGLSN